MPNEQGGVPVDPMDVIAAYQKQLSDAHHTIALLSARLVRLEGGEAPRVPAGGGPPKSPGVERAELRWASDPDDAVARENQVALPDAPA